MKARDVAKRRILADVLKGMSEEELREYVLSKDNQHKEVMDALARQHDLILNIAKRVERQNWYVDFGSDLLANITTDTLIWLGSKLFKR